MSKEVKQAIKKELYKPENLAKDICKFAKSADWLTTEDFTGVRQAMAEFYLLPIGSISIKDITEQVLQIVENYWLFNKQMELANLLSFLDPREIELEHRNHKEVFWKKAQKKLLRNALLVLRHGEIDLND